MILDKKFHGEYQSHGQGNWEGAEVVEEGRNVFERGSVCLAGARGR